MQNMTTYEYDAAIFLDNDELIAHYLNEAKNDGYDTFLEALATVARAKGMSDLAQKTGLSRESLYKSLKKGANPRYETIEKILRALNVKTAFVRVG